MLHRKTLPYYTVVITLEKKIFKNVKTLKTWKNKKSLKRVTTFSKFQGEETVCG